MTEESVKISEDLLRKMERFPEFDWNELVNKTIEERLLILEKFETMTSNSKLTEDDTIDIGRKMNRDALEKYLKRRI